MEDTRTELTVGGKSVRVTDEEFAYLGKHIDEVAERVASKAAKHLAETKARLFCHLTDAELLERGRELAEAIRELEAFEIAEAVRRKEVKGEIMEMERTVARLAHTVNTGSELRDVIVVSDVVPMAEGVMVQETRADTGEIVNIRPATGLERQMGMGL